ncbi:hypothetical protein TWF694_010217 [Orbilia ellipsospora]|uniref:CFEM domain-containing protein n=1 Tax=Orbilia ellipsospora TaxID=2528407 RepID=A0AAV9XA59_9PEZI
MQQATHSFIRFLILFLVTTTTIFAASPADSTVDFSNVPNCAVSSCLDTSSEYNWKSTPSTLLCPNDIVTNSCFCSLSLRPLLCYPYDPTSQNSTTCFASLTNWYTTLCSANSFPNPQKTLNYLQLPTCAIPCAQTATSHLGCPFSALNCVCQLTSYLPSNLASCIKNNCKADIQTYIGDLTVFARKLLNQACNFTPADSGSAQAMSAYDNTPQGHPQSILVSNFQGPEYTNWQNGVNSKREKTSNLAAILPLSLIFGGIFGMIGLQWLLQLLGLSGPSYRRRNGWAARAWAKIGVGFEKLGKGIVFVVGAVVMGCGFVFRWMVKGGKWLMGK